MTECLVGTMNVNHHGTAKIPDIVTVMQLNSISVCALQELNINQFSCPGFIAAFQQHNCTAVLGEFSPQHMCRTGLVANVPLRQVKFANITQPDRYAAGVLEWRRGANVEKLLVCCIYGDASNSRLAAVLVHELVHALNQFHCRWILIGDFNLVPTDPAISELEASGQVCCMDCNFGSLELLPATGPGRRRRIDFGLCSRTLHPSSLLHFPRIADHLGVAYGFTGDPSSDGCRPPAHRPLLEHDCHRVSAHFPKNWCGSDFQEACFSGDVNSQTLPKLV